jgi:hypothetical protein
MPTGEPAGSIPNVGASPDSIKGKGTGRRSGSSHAVFWAQLFLEQLFGRGTMRIDCRHVALDPCNLGFQRLDPRRQLVLRNWAKVLLGKQSQGILRLAGKEVILVHARNR